MVKIILVRHAECEGNIINALTGRTEYELTSKGKETANKLAKELQKYNISEIYSSPLKRCIDTIKPTANQFKLKIKCKQDLIEKYFGIYDGKTWKEIQENAPEILENKKKYNKIMGIPEQETTEEVQVRISRCINEIVNENEEKTILICSHGCAIEIFLRSIDNVESTEQLKKYSQSNGAINILEKKDEKFNIITINQTEYMGKYEKNIKY